MGNVNENRLSNSDICFFILKKGSYVVTLLEYENAHIRKHFLATLFEFNIKRTTQNSIKTLLPTKTHSSSQLNSRIIFDAQALKKLLLINHLK